MCQIFEVKESECTSKLNKILLRKTETRWRGIMMDKEWTEKERKKKGDRMKK